jgi:hypothetical protein
VFQRDSPEGMKREAGASLKNFIFDYSGTAPATVIE